MGQLDVGRMAMTPKGARDFLKELGMGSQLWAGKIRIDDDGVVTVKGPRKNLFKSDLRNETDLQELRRALRSLHGTEDVYELAKPGAFRRTFDVARLKHYEQRANTRRLGDGVYKGELQNMYMGGRKFDMPLFALPKTQAEILTCDEDRYPELEEIRALFEDDESIAMAVHPQEVRKAKHLGNQPDWTLEVANASSERTFYHYEPSVPQFLLKVPLPTVTHFNFTRPIAPLDAQRGVAMTRYLRQFADRSRRADDPFAFLPEPMAIVDKKGKSANVIRLATPYPPPADPESTWLMPAYSLYAPDVDRPGSRPVLADMIDGQRDKKPVEFLIDDILGPLVKSAMRLYLDLGAAGAVHGQNIFLEIDMKNGKPTGRGVHADIEGIWPHPAVIKEAGLPDFYKEHGFDTHPPRKTYTKKNKKEIFFNVEYSFNNYFLYGLALPILRTFRDAYPDHADAANQAFKDLMTSEIKARRGLVSQFARKDQVYEEFATALDDNYDLQSHIDEEQRRNDALVAKMRKKKRLKAENFRLMK